jgi:hypothetical protein
MKIKRITAAVLAAAMCLSLTVTSFAETEDLVVDEVPSSEFYPPSSPSNSQASNSDVNLQTALTTVKKRVTIPDSLTEFSYTTSTNNGVTTYRFTWSTDGKNSGIQPLDSSGRAVSSMSATVVGDIITRYSKNYSYSASSDSDNGAKLGKIPVSSFVTYAKNNVDKLNPGMSSHITFKNPSASLYSQAVSVQFTRTENGINVSNNSGRIAFDNNTGEITNFSVTWWDDATFKSPAAKISETKMETAYEAAIKLNKQYVIKRDYETKKISAAITYKPETNYEFDAFTGKESTMWDDYQKAMQTTGMAVAEPATGEGIAADEMLNDMAVAEEADSEVSFSAAEQRAINENEDMIKRDEATAIILKDPYIGLTTKYQLTSSQLYTKNDFGITNFWSLRYLINTDDRYDSINVTLDADSGSVLSFSKNGYDKAKTGTTEIQALDETKADKTAEAAFKYYMGEKVLEYKDSVRYDDPVYEEDSKGNNIITSKTYYKDRFHNDIIVEGEVAQININAKGEITRMDYQYTDVDFPDATVLSQSAAYDKLWTQIDFDHYYSGFVGLNGKASTYLMYRLKNFTLNAKTGVLSDYYGDPLEKYEQSEISYSDLHGSKYKTAVETLQAYGVYLNPISGKFSSGSSITQGEFNRLIGNIYGSASLSEADSKKSLTKADAAKIYVQATGGEKFAKLSGIYKSPYADVPENHAYVGYIAIAKAEGVFESGGNFAPSSNLTRGDAIMMIYEMVN